MKQSKFGIFGTFLYEDFSFPLCNQNKCCQTKNNLLSNSSQIYVSARILNKFYYFHNQANWIIPILKNCIISQKVCIKCCQFLVAKSSVTQYTRCVRSCDKLVRYHIFAKIFEKNVIFREHVAKVQERELSVIQFFCSKKSFALNLVEFQIVQMIE